MAGLSGTTVCATTLFVGCLEIYYQVRSQFPGLHISTRLDAMETKVIHQNQREKLFSVGVNPSPAPNSFD
jgi:hypothetical protein